jgi:hypothetical protein
MKLLAVLELRGDLDRKELSVLSDQLRQGALSALDEAFSAWDPDADSEENMALRRAAIGQAASQHLGAPCWTASIEVDSSFQHVVGSVPPASINGIHAAFLNLGPDAALNSDPFFELDSEASFSLEITEVGDRLVGFGEAEGAWYESYRRQGELGAQCVASRVHADD